MHAITKFRHYLHLNLQALIYIVNKATLRGKMARWILLLQEFDFEIKQTLGNENSVANFLSRLENPNPTQE